MSASIVLSLSSTTVVFGDNARPYSTEPKGPIYKPLLILLNPRPSLIDQISLTGQSNITSNVE